MLEVDLDNPQELHKSHNDHPLAAEKINVSKSTLSNYCERITQKHKISIAQVRKLVPTLSTTTTKYVLHHRNLQFYMASLKYSSKPTFKSCKIFIGILLQFTK